MSRPFCSCVSGVFSRAALQTHNDSLQPAPDLASERSPLPQGVSSPQTGEKEFAERVSQISRNSKVSGPELSPDALPVPAQFGRMPDQAQGVQQHTPCPGVSEGIHGAFRERRRKQEHEVGKTDRGRNRRRSWQVADFIFGLFSGAIFIRFVFPLVTTEKLCRYYKLFERFSI